MRRGSAAQPRTACRARSAAIPASIGKVQAFDDRLHLRYVLSVSGMRRSTLLELSGMELDEVAHVHRCLAGEFAQGVRHAVVTPLLSQLSHD
jgi:hypothetical protein